MTISKWLAMHFCGKYEYLLTLVSLANASEWLANVSNDIRDRGAALLGR
ncbi:MAG: hypothetical protein QOD90_1664 [Mycobacterium sp.]|jgi:hypothetical protein|nr:hypothetical protein [Mycobacterium sp.]